MPRHTAQVSSTSEHIKEVSQFLPSVIINSASSRYAIHGGGRAHDDDAAGEDGHGLHWRPPEAASIVIPAPMISEGV